jgi:hypothetical protein
MRIKLNRGPMKGQYVDVEEENPTRFEVRVMPRRDLHSLLYDSDDPLPEPRRGHYQRSNVTLKNGAAVFEWMGWRE